MSVQLQAELDNTQPNQEEVDTQEAPEQSQEAAPPGWKSYEQYVADGGDPDEFKGAKVFGREYERMVNHRGTKAEKKALERQIKEMGQNMVTVMQQQKKQMNQQIANQNAQKDAQIAQLSADLMKAHEDMDTRKTEKITKEINKLESAKVEAPQEQVQQPFTPAQEALGDFIQSNPILNPNNGSFDKELENAVAVQLESNFNPNMKTYAAVKMFDKALADAKASIPRFNQKEPKKAANTRQPGNKGVKGGKPSVNSLPPESKEMYEYLLHNMGSEKLGKEAAANYLKTWSLDNG